MTVMINGVHPFTIDQKEFPRLYEIISSENLSETRFEIFGLPNITTHDDIYNKLVEYEKRLEENEELLTANTLDELIEILNKTK